MPVMRIEGSNTVRRGSLPQLRSIQRDLELSDSEVEIFQGYYCMACGCEHETEEEARHCAEMDWEYQNEFFG